MAELISSIIDGETLIEVDGVLKVNVGTTANTVAAGDDSRLALAATSVQPSQFDNLVAVLALHGITIPTPVD